MTSYRSAPVTASQSSSTWAPSTLAVGAGASTGVRTPDAAAAVSERSPSSFVATTVYCRSVPPGASVSTNVVVSVVPTDSPSRNTS